MSTAFDLVDHQILLTRLVNEVGVTDRVLSWLKSYLCNRTQNILINSSTSDPVKLQAGVPQGSVLYLVYTLPLHRIFEDHKVSYHSFADDTQIYARFSPSCPRGRTECLQKLETCIDEVTRWMKANKLKLNTAKMEFVIFLSPRHADRSILVSSAIMIAGELIKPSSVVCNPSGRTKKF